MRSFVLYCTGFCFRSQRVMFCIVLRCVLFQKPKRDPLYCISPCFVSEAKMISFALHCTVFCLRSQGVILNIALHCVLFQKPRCDTLHCIALCFVSEVKV